MTKLTLTLLFFFFTFFTGCSSIPKEKSSFPQQTALEDKALEYIYAGNSFKNKGDYKSAMDYYNSASEIFFLKWSKKNFVLAKTKALLMAYKLKKYKYLNKELFKIKKFNEIEDLNLDMEILYVEYKQDQIQNKKTSALKKLERIINHNVTDKLKGSYYRSIRVNDYDIVSKEEKTIEIAFIEKQFRDYTTSKKSIGANELEILIYLNYTLCKYYISEDFHNKAVIYMQSYENLITNYELTNQMPKFFYLKTLMAKKKGLVEKERFYRGQLEKLNYLKMEN